MSDSLQDKSARNGQQPAAELPPPAVSRKHQVNAAAEPNRQRQENRRWWIKLFVQPALLVAGGAILFATLGVAQRLGIISAEGEGSHRQASVGASGSRYICPMMCTPPQAEPGRCPVCAMELVAATTGSGQADTRAVQLDPASRRIANIQTVAVQSIATKREIRSIGELSYDEGSLKTIAAYVDGRLERLYADYNGVVVKKGDHLALLYSPQLYSGQVELLLARKSRDDSRNSTMARVTQSNQRLYASARQRLIELGMTVSQIEELEEADEANSRLQLCAPISGTVIEKLAVEGQYVQEGDAIYKLADLSTVWLMLRLFPAEAAAIRYGQKVEAEVQSLPGRMVAGRVAFIDPNVDPKTRTVGVRVVIPNDDGLLRVGDYARATLSVPLADAQQTFAYDPELANKWISPRHPHIIADLPGDCPICGVELVPAAEFGFAGEPSSGSEAIIVPRDAVLMAGNSSVLYVETAPGRFEIRRIVLGPEMGDQIVIRSGVNVGEQVATRGNFLIDSQMQLAGNPSLIDPSRLEPSVGSSPSPAMIAALEKLSPDDRALVATQGVCPVADSRLGSMGTPKKVDVNGKPVFICCEGCRERLLSEPDKYLVKLKTRPLGEPLPYDAEATFSPLDLPPIGVPQIIEMVKSESETPAVREDANDAGPATRVADRAEEVVR